MTIEAKEDGYQVCTKCIMDTTDPIITFNEDGVCSYCTYFETTVRKMWHPDEKGAQLLSELVSEIKRAGEGKEYDCILGLSGGVDSSYLAYQAVKLGLRPLAVHVDAGWNSELAVKNIENIVKKQNIDLYTYVIDWEEIKDLQLSFLKASVANLDVPQDHSFTALLYKLASEKKIKYILSGGNFATESILPKSWGYNAMDLRHLKSIHNKFGHVKLKTYPTIGFFKYYFYYPYIKKIRVVRPLNYMEYIKDDAMETLTKEVGWRYYGGKHYESRYTKYFQAHYLPEKFGFDKRKAHLSSLIVSGQATREEALEEMKKELYQKDELLDDKEFFAKKLGVSLEEYDKLESLPNKTYKDYPSNEWLFNLKSNLRKMLGK